jgi:polysaccharide biosynthesis/export protein
VVGDALMRWAPPLCVLCFPLLSLGCAPKGVYVDAAAYVTTHRAPATKGNVVREGDTLSIRVFGEESLSTATVVVRQDGTIPLPLLGEHAVIGLAPRTIAANLAKELEPYLKDPHVTVVLTPAPIVIHVMGEIDGTGRKEYQDDVLLPEVMADSGALTDFANRNAVFVLRGKDRIRFHYTDILRGLPPARDFKMEHRDFVVVE